MIYFFFTVVGLTFKINIPLLFRYALECMIL